MSRIDPITSVGSESSHLGSRLNQLLQTAKVVPAVNQVEWVSLFAACVATTGSPFDRMHPHLAQQDLLNFCNERGIHITAYTPTG